jgi:hypothetical protein
MAISVFEAELVPETKHILGERRARPPVGDGFGNVSSERGRSSSRCRTLDNDTAIVDWLWRVPPGPARRRMANALKCELEPRQYRKAERAINVLFHGSERYQFRPNVRQSPILCSSVEIITRWNEGQYHKLRRFPARSKLSIRHYPCDSFMSSLTLGISLSFQEFGWVKTTEHFVNGTTLLLLMLRLAISPVYMRARPWCEMCLSLTI